MLTQIEALTHALALAILASTDANAQRAIKLAEELTQGLNSAEIKQAKRDARHMVWQAFQKGAKNG